VELSSTSPLHTRKLITLADFRLSSCFRLPNSPENNVQRQYKKPHHAFRSIYEPRVPITALKDSDKQEKRSEIFNLVVTYGHCSFLSLISAVSYPDKHCTNWQVVMNAVPILFSKTHTLDLMELI
jgi:hypothetical protein